MDTGFNTDIATTNREDYRTENILPSIKYHQVPSIQLKEAPKLPPRNFPIQPLGPNRHWEKFDHNILPNITPFTDKPIVRALPPNQIFNKSKSSKATTRPTISSDLGPFRRDEEGFTTDEIPKDVIDRLCHSLRWSTSTKKATEEASLPTPKHILFGHLIPRVTDVQVIPPNSTLEENVDVVMLRPKRFDSKPAIWQRVVPVWDRLQVRPHVGDIIGKVGAREQISSRQAYLENRHQVERTTQAERTNDPTQSTKETINKFCEEKCLPSTYIRQCPGYAGYVPRSPLAAPIKPAEMTPNLRMMTTMKASYRPIPFNGFLKHGHKGPLSGTVTLTFPYNPYNKVENRAFFRKDIEHPW